MRDPGGFVACIELIYKQKSTQKAATLLLQINRGNRKFSPSMLSIRLGRIKYISECCRMEDEHSNFSMLEIYRDSRGLETILLITALSPNQPETSTPTRDDATLPKQSLKQSRSKSSQSPFPPVKNEAR